MRRSVRALSVAAISLAVLATPGVDAQTVDPTRFAGEWRVNPEKSKYSAGPPPNAVATRVLENRGGGLLHLTGRNFDSKGKPVFHQSVFKCDGKRYPWVTKGSPRALSISCKAIDANGFDYIIHNAETSETIATGSYVVSKDGKTLTLVVNGTNLEGQPINNVFVYDFFSRW